MSRQQKSTTTKPSCEPSPAEGRDRPEWVEGYTFDAEAADRPVRFIEKFCRCPSPDGGPPQPMRLIEWQREKVIRPLFGWKRKDGRLRYRRGCVFVPKKNGKSFLMASVAQYMLTAHFPIADVYLAAVDRLQAREIYRVIAKFVNASPQLGKLLEVIDSKSLIRHREHGNVLRCLSADAYRNEGLNGSVIVDEIHAHKSDELISALTYATRATPNGLVLAISTAGDDRNSVGYQWWRDAELVIKNPAANPSFYGVIYAANPEDPRGFGDPAVWREANPSMGVTFREEEFAADYQDACTDGRKLSKWLRYSLDVWSDSDDRWFHGDAWELCSEGPPEPLEGRPCWVGLDMASHLDMTAAAFLFRSADGTYDVRMMYWVPEDTVPERERKDRIPYSGWIRDGHVTVTEGARLDHERVARDIIDAAAVYNVKAVAADGWNLGSVGTALQAAGLEVTVVGQSIGSLTAPSKLLESLVASRKLRHAGHPVLAWNANNVCVMTDTNGNIKPDKKRSREKIDGIAALVDALAVASTADDTAADDWKMFAL
jgi:phage terminase large subunit-like protein